MALVACPKQFSFYHRPTHRPSPESSPIARPITLDLTILPSGNDPKSSLPERVPGAERPEILSKQFPLKIFLDFFLEKILKIEKPMQIFSQKCLYA